MKNFYLKTMVAALLLLCSTVASASFKTNRIEYNKNYYCQNSSYLETMKSICDINTDGYVDVADIKIIIDVILSLYDNDDVYAYYGTSCDINTDGYVDIEDLTTALSFAKKESYPNIVTSLEESISIDYYNYCPVYEYKVEGTPHININVTNPKFPFCAIQFDLQLPEDIALASIDADSFSLEETNRADADYSSSFATFADTNTIRIFYFSMINYNFRGTEGAIMSIPLDFKNIPNGDYTFKISNIIISGSSKKYLANYSKTIEIKNDTNDIESILADEKKEKCDAIYDLFGCKVVNPIKGNIYIKKNKKFIVR